MTSNSPENKYPNLEKSNFHFKLLTQKDLHMIEEALSEVGEYGEVRLVIEKRRLRFIITQKSCDVMKWVPKILKKDAP